MNDKQFYTEFLRQAKKYLLIYPDAWYYLCFHNRDCRYDKETYLSKFGYIVANKIGLKARNPKYSMIPSRLRFEVITEAIRYCEYKLNQLK